MHDEGLRTALPRDHIDEVSEVGIVVLRVDADAALHSDRQPRRRPHGSDAARHERRLGHQAGPKRPKRPFCTRSLGQPTFRLTSS